AVECLFDSKSAAVRRNAALVLPRTKGMLTLLGTITVYDKDPQVRLAALLAMSEMPEEINAYISLLIFSEKPENMKDRWIPDAITIAAAKHALPFLTQVSDQHTYGPRALEIIGIVAEHYARGGPGESVGELLRRMNYADVKNAEVILAGLAKGWPKD